MPIIYSQTYRIPISLFIFWNRELIVSRVEQIGSRLYGSSWQAQIASELKNEDGESIARQTVQSWHKRDTLPHWAINQLIEIAKQRELEVVQAIELLAEINGQ